MPTHSFIAYSRMSWPLGSMNCSMRPVEGSVPSNFFLGLGTAGFDLELQDIEIGIAP